MTTNEILILGSDDVRLRIPLILELRGRGFSIAAAGTEDAESFLDHAIPYVRYKLNRTVSPLSDLTTLRRLQQIFEARRPDLVHAFTTKPAILGPLAARRAGVPGIVRTVTGMGQVFSSRSPLLLGLRPLYRFLQRRASGASQITVFQNDEDRDYFLRHRLVRSGHDRLIRGSGIDLKQLESSRPGPGAVADLRRELKLNGQLVVIMVARLVKQKGVREYLEMARHVRAAMRNVVFLLVGPHPKGQRNAVSLDLVRRSAEDIRWLGARADVPALLGASDVAVLPTYYREGVPRVLLEAGAMGLPLVSTDMPGCRDAVRDGWNGFLLPPRDVGAFASAILKLLRSRSLRATMGARSVKLVNDQFGLDRVADAHARIYEGILRRATPVPGAA